MRQTASLMGKVHNELGARHMEEPLVGVAALLQDRIDRLAQMDEWLPRYEGSESGSERKQHQEEMEQLQSE